MMSYAQWGNALYSGEKSYRIVPKRRIFVRAALAVIVVCAILIGIFGLNRSFEFTGGSQFTLTGLSETSQQPAYDAIQKGNLASEVRVSSVGVDGIRVQTESLDSQKTLEVREALASAYKVDAKDVQSASIGPSWGRDVTAKAAQSLVIFFDACRSADGCILQILDDVRRGDFCALPRYCNYPWLLRSYSR